MRARRLLLLALLTACPRPPTQYEGPIPVQPHAAERGMVLLNRFRGHGTDDAPAAHARVHVMKAGEELRGPNAVGTPGGLRLENGERPLVSAQLGAGRGLA